MSDLLSKTRCSPNLGAVLLVGQKLRFGISKYCCPFLHFLMASQSEIRWIVLQPTSRPLQKEVLLAINLKNIHKIILGQMSRACSLILQLIPESFAVLRNCCLWVRYVWKRQPANTCPKLNTMNLSRPRNWVDFSINWVKFRVRIRFGAWEYNGIYLILVFLISWVILSWIVQCKFIFGFIRADQLPLILDLQAEGRV